MGDIAEGLINGDFDFYTGEYLGRGYGFPRTHNRSLDWERRRRHEMIPNPRKGIMTYIHRAYIGRAKMPKALLIAKHYADEIGIIWTSEQEMFAAISIGFFRFKEWMGKNADNMYHLYLSS